MNVHQPLVADARHGAARVAAELLGAFDVALVDLRVDVLHQPLRIDFRQRQVGDAFNAKGQAEHQCQRYERHKQRRAVDEHFLQAVVNAARFGIEILAQCHVVHCNGC